MTVSGRLVDANGDEMALCAVELHLASNDEVVDWQKVDSNFREAFLVKPRSDSYYVTANCGGGERGRSKEFTFDNSHTDAPIQLGTIVVRLPAVN